MQKKALSIWPSNKNAVFDKNLIMVLTCIESFAYFEIFGSIRYHGELRKQC